MRNFCKYFFFLFIIASVLVLLSEGEAYAQQSKVDSLEKLLQNEKHDSIRLRLYLALGDACDVKDNLKYGESAMKLIDKLLSQTTNNKEREKLLKQKANAFDYFIAFYQDKNDTSKIFEYSRKQLSIYLEVKDTANIVNTINICGRYYNEAGNFPKELECYQNALSISKEMNYKKGIASSLYLMGDIYNGIDDAQALENYQQGLSIYYELKDTGFAAQVLTQIGNLYSSIHNITKAFDCYQKAIALHYEIKNKRGVIFTYNCIGGMYQENNDFQNALVNFQKGLSIAEEMNDKYWVAILLNYIGDVYCSLSDYPKAIDYQLMGLKKGIGEEFMIGNTSALSFASLAHTYLKQRNYKKAKDYSLRSLTLRKKQGIVGSIRNAELLVSEVDSASGNSNGAYEHYKQYIILRDKLNSEEVRKSATREKFQNEYDKQKAIAKAEQDKKDAITAEEKRRQKIITYSVSAGLLFVLLLALLIFRGYRQKQKSNFELAEKNKIIEEKNKDITDSINYAKRIQSSFLAPLNEITASLPNSFVLFKPKDIVSGDFYWFEKKDNKIFIAACDCTGHGVPGAIMSMLGADKLNEALAQTTDVSLMLNAVNRGVKKALRQSGNEDSTRDGMDIALLSFKESSQKHVVSGAEPSKEIEYAGANRPLYIIRNSSTILEEIKPTKSAIGGLTSDEQIFTKHTIQLNKGDTVYISSDGFADQFSPDDKKLMTKKFKEILVSIQDKTMEEQKNYLDTFIENWKGNMEQTDDVLVIGIRI